MRASLLGTSWVNHWRMGIPAVRVASLTTVPWYCGDWDLPSSLVVSVTMGERQLRAAVSLLEI